jgi:DNA-binding transcriptional LysR family regulator
MPDSLSLDQLRTFVAAVDEGSFSAAARKQSRVQSAVSDLIAKLEANIGVQLFDRSARYPTLTKEGAVLLADARSVLAGVDALRARAKGISSGIEAELSVVVDVMFPMAPITEAAKAFRETFPGTPLRVYVEALGGAYQPLLDRRASLGIVGPQPAAMAASLTSERLPGIPMVMVAARYHPLAGCRSTIPNTELAKHVQLVLTDRSSLSDGKDFYVVSPFVWRLADLSAKRAFLIEGLGWGGMPRHAVEADIEDGRLVVLSIEDFPAGGLVRPASAAYPTDSPPGPAGRWFIDRLKSCANASAAKPGAKKQTAKHRKAGRLTKTKDRRRR